MDARRRDDGLLTVRIGLDAREWEAGKHTGIGRYIETLLRRAVDARPDLRWTLFLHPGDTRRIVAEAVRYVEMPRASTPLVDQHTIPGLLRDDSHDLFFSPYPKGPWKAPCPTIVVPHDMHRLVLPVEQGGLTGMRRHWFRWYAGRSARRAARVVTVSQASANDIVACLGVSPERIRVIYEQVDPALLAGRRDGALQALGIQGAYFLAVGGLVPHKNQETIVRAWARIEAGGRPRLVLAGEGPERRRLEALAAEVGVDRHVRFAGGVDNDVLAELYRGAVALLHPAVIEGFGLPVVEAMALGTPVIVSSGGSLPEIAGDGAPVLDPADVDAWAEAAGRMFADEPYRRDQAARAERRAQDFAPERTTDRLLDLIAETASR